jgi:SOS-response transcriptional repressor LexA
LGYLKSVVFHNRPVAFFPIAVVFHNIIFGHYITYRDYVNSFLDIFLKNITFCDFFAEREVVWMIIGDRFKAVRQMLGLNQAQMAKELSINPSLISDIERGDKEPSKKVITSLITRYKINANWLLAEEGDIHIKQANGEKSQFERELEQIIEINVKRQTGDKFSEIDTRLSELEEQLKRERLSPHQDGPLYTAEPEPEYDTEAEHEAEKQVQITYVEDIAAGPPIAQSEDQTGLVSVPARLVKKGSRYYAASIRGGSMSEAGIRDGDMVLIRHTGTPADRAIQVVRYHGKSTLKRLREVEGKGWELHYEDGSGRVVLLDSGDYEVQGEFVAILPKIVVPAPPKKRPI